MSGKPYGLICPISRACEILEPRWTIQILSELWNGSTRFNDIRRGVGNISSALLSKRLKDLEAAGLVERVESRATGLVDYIRTEKAIKLEPALNMLAQWAQCNIEADIALRGADVSTLMWGLRRKIDMSQLPRRRAVVRFHFNDNPRPDYPTYWMVGEPGSSEPEMCTADPGMDIDLYVETNTISLGAILTGRSSFDREIERGALFLSGDAGLARTISRWLRVSEYAAFEGIVPLHEKAALPAAAQ